MYDTKEIERLVKKFNSKGGKYHTMTTDDLIMNAKRYIKAVKERRVICSIGSVSSSGMSITIKFLEMPRKGGYLLNFYNLFDVLGYTKIKDSDYFRISGCGMDMVFNTNYNIIHELKHMGFISKKTASSLCQETPQVV